MNGRAIGIIDQDLTKEETANAILKTFYWENHKHALIDG